MNMYRVAQTKQDLYSKEFGSIANNQTFEEQNKRKQKILKQLKKDHNETRLK